MFLCLPVCLSGEVFVALALRACGPRLYLCLSLSACHFHPLSATRRGAWKEALGVSLGRLLPPAGALGGGAGVEPVEEGVVLRVDEELR